MNRRMALVILALGAVVLAVGVFFRQTQEPQAQECTKELFAMDTIMRFTAYGPHGGAAVDAAIEEIQRLDALLSTGSASSEVSRINSTKSGPVSEDTGRLAAAALELYRSTGGLFDCTIYPLMQLWGFPTQAYHVPTPEELAELLPLVDASRVRLDGGTLTLAEGQQIDFGGVAKGYASQRVMEIFQSHGVTSGMVSLGGNIQTLGAKPDGSDWRIGVQDPEGAPGTLLAVLAVRDRAVVTSGGYERYFEENGKTYIHILDPRTGCPADSDLLSVTVVEEDGTEADALSTALFIMGKEGACDYWRSADSSFEMILVTAEGEICVTEGISGSLETEGSVSVIRAD